MTINGCNDKTIECEISNNPNANRNTPNGQVQQYYMEDSHPAIIDKEMERRREFTRNYGIQKLGCATEDNSFAGRVIYGSSAISLAEKCRIQPMIGSGGSPGAATASMW